MKFHLNPSTGAPGRCGAREVCPFGDASEHYSSAVEASRAYEAQQGGSFSQASGEASTVPTHRRGFSEEDHREHRLRARELLDLLSKDGEFELPDEEVEYDDEEDRVVVRVGSFRLLASGAAVNAYLHEPSNTVYKIPHFEAVGELWSASVSKTLIDLAKAERAKYEALDEEALAAQNVRYTPTRYFGLKTSQGPVPIVVQAYLDPETYEPHYLTGTEQNALARFGLWDLNMGNVRRYRPTGELVMLDCVPAF